MKFKNYLLTAFLFILLAMAMLSLGCRQDDNAQIERKEVVIEDNLMG